MVLDREFSLKDTPCELIFQMIVYKLVCMQCTSLQILLYRARYYDTSCKSCSKSDKSAVDP